MSIDSFSMNARCVEVVEDFLKSQPEDFVFTRKSLSALRVGGYSEGTLLTVINKLKNAGRLGKVGETKSDGIRCYPQRRPSNLLKYLPKVKIEEVFVPKSPETFDFSQEKDRIEMRLIKMKRSDLVEAVKLYKEMEQLAERLIVGKDKEIASLRKKLAALEEE